MLEYVPGTNQY